MPTRPVTGGVDTHLDVNVAAALDAIGGLLGVAEFPTTPAGHRRLAKFLASFGTLTRVGVEGTGSYGAGLSRYLRGSGVEVVEVDRPNRQSRRRTGKSDPVDAIEAARAALSAEPKERARAATATWRRSGPRGRQALVAFDKDPDPESDSPSRLHRSRRAPLTPEGVSRSSLAKKAAALRPRAGGDRGLCHKDRP